MKRVVSGILVLALGLLGMYCSVRAFQVHRGLNGRPDVHDSVRNWSTAATACFVACAVIATLSRKKAATVGHSGAATDSPPSRWWRTPVGITLLAAAVIVAVVIVIFVLQPPPRAISPTAAPPPLESPPAPASGPSAAP